MEETRSHTDFDLESLLLVLANKQNGFHQGIESTQTFCSFQGVITVQNAHC
ncbi:MAG: hypothetical protein IGR93_08875 [Hydrococcus sp. C42_A2020_068]|nr:hypothetical protein [Hydrococcus sp. C42_A2020_068]